MSIYDRDYYKRETNPNWGQSPYGQSFQLGSGMPPVVKWLLIINIAVFLFTALGKVIIPQIFSNRLEIINTQTNEKAIAFLSKYKVDSTIDGHFSDLQPFSILITKDKFIPLTSAVVVKQKHSPFTKWFGLYNPYFFKHFAFWQLITYQFLHGGFFHIFFNMFSLYMIGRIFERQIGSRSFLLLYLLGGIFAGLTNIIANIFSGMPTVGASGAICAIVAAFGLMNPNARMGMLFLFIPIFMRAKTFVYVFAFITILMALTGGENIAHMAHLGGLIFGWLYAYNYWGIGSLISGDGSANFHTHGSSGDFIFNLKRKMGFGPKIYKGEEFEDANFEEVNHEKNWDPRIDKILDKMSKYGIQSLTDEEWELLGKHKEGKL